MGLFFVYSIKVALCLAGFYLVYKALLSRETFHSFNRFMLMAVVMVSLALPFMHINSQTTASNGFVVVEEMIMQGEMMETKTESHLTMLQILFIVYIIGVTGFLAKDIASIISLRRLIARGRKTKGDDGISTIVIDEDIAPFSWFNYIVISATDYRENPRDIITHETAHIRHRHSLDILLCNLLITFQWYNPAAWLIKKELQDIHEYEADEEVINRGIDAQHYQLLLIRKAVGERLFSMANNMNHNSLKKRIRMMKTSKSNPWSRMKAVVTIPVAAIAVVAFASPKAKTMATTIEAESNEIVSRVAESNNIISSVANDNEPSSFVEETIAPVDSAKKAKTDEKVYDLAEKLPQFPGGMAAMVECLKNNMKYPENAKKNNVEGRVIVTFIVDKEGNVTSPQVMRSVDADLDAEALRVVSAMPKWIPGEQDGKAINCKFTIPISFKNSDGKTVDDARSIAAKDHVYYVDGKKVTADELKAIEPSTIKEMRVLKDEKSLKQYGESNPIVIISLKK